MAQAGQPIVQAIQDYHKQTGSYPPSLFALMPKYLADFPPIPHQPYAKFFGAWDYRVLKHYDEVYFTLSMYMDDGNKVTYEWPYWFKDEVIARKR
jgi:hypothetical protein